MLRSRSSLKILGAVIDEQLNYSDNCNAVIKNCYRGLSLLYPPKYVLSTESKTILIDAFICSILNYSLVIWRNHISNKQTINFNNVIRHAAIYVLNKRKFDSVKYEICNKLEWFLLKYKIMYENVCFAFKLTYLSSSHNFSNYLNFSFIESLSTR